MLILVTVPFEIQLFKIVFLEERVHFHFFIFVAAVDSIRLDNATVLFESNFSQKCRVERLLYVKSCHFPLNEMALLLNNGGAPVVIYRSDLKSTSCHILDRVTGQCRA